MGRSLHEECADGVAALAAANGAAQKGNLLAFFPHAARNPYQRMLYARGFDHGFACFPLKAIGDVADLPEEVKLVLHYHWLHKAFDGANDARGAKKAADHFLEKLAQQKDAGHKIVWTVHNILSHSAAFPEEEMQLRARTAEIADVIHIMNPKTIDLCREIFSIDPAKVIEVPHPSYRGVYGDYLCRSQARFNLGLQHDDEVFLLFGSLGPHKGTRQFLSMLDSLQGRLGGKARIIVAGTPGEPRFMQEILEIVSSRSDVQLFQAHIDDQAVQTFFKAADVVVCPYPIGLNSGVMVTAAGFKCPVVVPDMMEAACVGIEDAIVPFKAGDMFSCADACIRALSMSQSEEISAKLDHWADAHRPELVSARFFEALRARL
ncbi:MAG: glycosyltransferase [Alphaproteobacteria bacterium]|nr:glycosyltransferase [Alphaproteobacteria bacterium]